MIEFPIKEEKAKYGDLEFSIFDLPINFFIKTESKEIVATDVNILIYGTSLKEEEILDLPLKVVSNIAKKVIELSELDNKENSQDKKK
jgi:hypothetical protein